MVYLPVWGAILSRPSSVSKFFTYFLNSFGALYYHFKFNSFGALFYDVGFNFLNFNHALSISENWQAQQNSHLKQLTCQSDLIMTMHFVFSFLTIALLVPSGTSLSIPTNSGSERVVDDPPPFYESARMAR